jgi:hypothetical protein
VWPWRRKHWVAEVTRRGANTQPAPGGPSGLLCHYCDTAPAAGWDHIVPKSLGGRHSLWNRQPACRSCDLRKGNDMPTCKCHKCTMAAARWRDGERRELPPAIPMVREGPTGYRLPL